MGGCHNKGSKGYRSGGRNTVTAKIQAEIDKLKAQNVKLLQSDYTGGKNWAKQLESRTRQAAKNNRQIDKLERQLKNQSKEKPAKKAAAKKTTPKWQKAGQGWYIGEKGHEIRENYDKGGFDIVKVKGNDVVQTVKHFSKLSDARQYNV